MNPQPTNNYKSNSQKDSQETVNNPQPNTPQSQKTAQSENNHPTLKSTRTSGIEEIEKLRETVKTSVMPEELRERANRNIDRLYRMAQHGGYTGEFEAIQKYIFWITSIPWGNFSKDNLDIENAKKTMMASHYGIDHVKELILDYLAVMKLKAKQAASARKTSAESQQKFVQAPVLLFVGLQGVGKTTLAKSIARAMNRKFVRIPVGAIGNTAVLRGQPRGLPNAEPGQIIKGLTRTKTMNPVILLDEIDKASGNKALLSDIMATLLEILDPEQNSSFIDQYIDHPVDLSKTFFICTANNLGTISTALLDRMEVIRFSSYTDEEKEIIAKNYSMPKVLKDTGLSPEQVVIEDNVWPQLIRPVGFDAGLRQLERNLATIARRAARKILNGVQTPIVITSDNLRDYVIPDQGPRS